MAARNYSNVAPPLALTAGVTAAATTLSVTSTAGYPEAPFILGLERGTANEEVVLCTATTATSFTVTRGFDGTTARPHDIGTSVEHTVAAIDYREANLIANVGDAKGDLIVHTAPDTPVRLAVGNDRGLLLADAARAEGLRWGNNPLLVGVTEAVASNANANGTVTLDLATSLVWNLTQTGHVTVAFSNVPTGQSVGVTVLSRQPAGGGLGIGFTNGRYPNGTQPQYATNGNAVNVWSLWTIDGGANWYVFLSGKDMR